MYCWSLLNECFSSFRVKKLFLDVISSIVSLSSPLTKDHVNGALLECVLMITKVRTRLHALKQTVSWILQTVRCAPTLQTIQVRTCVCTGWDARNSGARHVTPLTAEAGWPQTYQKASNHNHIGAQLNNSKEPFLMSTTLLKTLIVYFTKERSSRIQNSHLWGHTQSGQLCKWWPRATPTKGW